MRKEYEKQVRLLLQVLPALSVTDDFALKGGTAINFFVRDFPRLSVDIDLTYLPIKGRDESLEEISQNVNLVAWELKKRITEVQIQAQCSGGTLSKLIIRAGDAQVKLEVNTVLRGALFGTVEMELSQTIQNEFQLFTVINALSFEDLYGGKLCAALDRQHPRDLYDVWELLKNEGITDDVRKAFIGYLISHSRPVNELLNPNTLPIEELYHKEFSGMTNDDSILSELQEVQHTLSKQILRDLTSDEKEFLISFKKGTPIWEYIDLPGLKDMPAVKWKLINLSKMDKQKHLEAIRKLEKVLIHG